MPLTSFNDEFCKWPASVGLVMMIGGFVAGLAIASAMFALDAAVLAALSCAVPSAAVVAVPAGSTDAEDVVEFALAEAVVVPVIEVPVV